MNDEPAFGFFDGPLDDAEAAARAHVLHLARVEGAEIAYRALKDIASDKKGAAAARGAAARTILEMAGALNWRDRAAAAPQKPVSEMDGNELKAAIAASQRLIRLHSRKEAEETEKSEGAFG